MTKANYNQRADGYYHTKIWNGTYNSNESKYRIFIQSKKSTAILKKQINLLKENIKNGNIVQSAEHVFLKYIKIKKNF